MSGNLLRWNLMWLLVAMIVGMAASAGGGAICDDVVAQLLPCSDFLKSSSTAPSADCCNGAQSVDKVAKLSKDYSRMVCQCLRDFATSVPVNAPRARQLVKICHVSGNIKFDRNAKC